MLNWIDAPSIGNNLIAAVVFGLVVLVGPGLLRFLKPMKRLRQLHGATNFYLRYQTRAIYLSALTRGATSQIVNLVSIPIIVILCIPLSVFADAYNQASESTQKWEALAATESSELPAVSSDSSIDPNQKRSEMVKVRTAALIVLLMYSGMVAHYTLNFFLQSWLTMTLAHKLETYAQGVIAIATKDEAREAFKLRLAISDFDNMNRYLSNLSELAEKYGFPDELLIQPLFKSDKAQATEQLPPPHTDNSPAPVPEATNAPGAEHQSPPR